MNTQSEKSTLNPFADLTDNEFDIMVHVYKKINPGVVKFIIWTEAIDNTDDELFIRFQVDKPRLRLKILNMQEELLEDMEKYYAEFWQHLEKK